VLTVEDAYDALKPEIVRTAEGAGLEITRQGDIFAVPTELTTREVRRIGYGDGRSLKRAKVLETDHSASEVVFAPGGRVYARGCLYHDVGGWRDSDHARRRMGNGKAWHLLARNTVPRSAPDRRASRRIGGRAIG
jgi:hypothetical protein